MINNIIKDEPFTTFYVIEMWSVPQRYLITESSIRNLKENRAIPFKHEIVFDREEADAAYELAKRKSISLLGDDTSRNAFKYINIMSKVEMSKSDYLERTKNLNFNFTVNDGIIVHQDVIHATNY